MGKTDDLPKRLSQKTAKQLLEEHGWSEVRGGKHVVKMTKAGCRPITLPAHKGADYGPGLTAGILRSAGLKGADNITDSDRTGTEGEI